MTCALSKNEEKKLMNSRIQPSTTEMNAFRVNNPYH